MSRDAGRASFWRLLARSFRFPGTIALVVGAGAVLMVTRFLRPYLAGPLMQDVIEPMAVEGIALERLIDAAWPIASLFALTIVLQPFAVFARIEAAWRLVAGVRRDLDRDVARKLLRAPLHVHRKGASGDFLARAIADTRLSAESMLLLYGEILINFQLVVAGGIALFLSSWPLALLTVVALPPLGLLIAYFGNRVQRKAHQRQESQGDLSQRLLSILAGIKVIKAFQGQRVEEEAYAAETERFLQRHMNVVWNANAGRAVAEFVNPVIFLGVLGVGAWLVWNDLWEVEFATLVQFALILMTAYRPAKILVQNYPRIMESLGSVERLFEVLDMETETVDPPGARVMSGLEHSIDIRDLHFSYGDEPVLSGIDLSVSPGEVIAIVGRTGAGKSTLVDLVLRFHDPTRGSIEIDGVDLRDYARASFLDRVAVVTQEPFLFDTTVRENIRYGRRDATDAEIRSAAEAASAHAFIEALPEGYETPVGEFGLRLSGGQRQRLTIARAIVADPAILVFDEATSALDAQTEAAVQTAIDSLRGHRTIFLVAHRLSTIRRADRIVVLDRGRVAQVGDHESLLASDGIYRELIGSQAA